MGSGFLSRSARRAAVGLRLLVDRSQALRCLATSLNAPRKWALLSTAPMRSSALLPMVSEKNRDGALAELRVTLERAAGDGSQDAESELRTLAAAFPEV